MSEEERAVIEAEIEEMWECFHYVEEEWIEGWITTGEAIERQKEIREMIKAHRDYLAE